METIKETGTIMCERNIFEDELFSKGNTTLKNNIYLTLDKVNVFCGKRGCGKFGAVKDILNYFPNSIKVICSNYDMPCNKGCQFRQNDLKDQNYFLRDLFDDFWAKRRLYLDYSYSKESNPPQMIYVIDNINLTYVLVDKLVMLTQRELAKELNTMIILITETPMQAFSREYLNVIEFPMTDITDIVWHKMEDVPKNTNYYKVLMSDGIIKEARYKTITKDWIDSNGLSISNNSMIAWKHLGK